MISARCPTGMTSIALGVYDFELSKLIAELIAVTLTDSAWPKALRHNRSSSSSEGGGDDHGSVVFCVTGEDLTLNACLQRRGVVSSHNPEASIMVRKAERTSLPDRESED